MRQIVCLLAVLWVALVTLQGKDVLLPDAPTALVCTFEKSAYVQQTASGELIAELSEADKPLVLEPGGLDSKTILVAGLDSKNPTVRGNLGEVKLEVLHKEGEIIWFAEIGPRSGLGGITVYTVFLKSKIVIESAQGNLTPRLAGVVSPIGEIAIGRCK